MQVEQRRVLLISTTSVRRIFSGNVGIIGVIALCFLLLAVPRLMFPDLDHGDEWADAENLTAAKNFVRFGFVQCRFRPILETGMSAPVNAYTHYPALAPVFSGLLQKYVPFFSLISYRIIALVFSFLGVVFWSLFVRNIGGSAVLALLFSLFYCTNPYFIYGMDSIAQMASAEFLRALFAFLLLRASRSHGDRKRRVAAALWCTWFILSMVTVEYAPFLLFFVLLYKYGVSHRARFPSWRMMVFLFAAPVAAFALHFLQNVWYFGSVSGAVVDLTQSAANRIMNTAGEGGQMTFTAWWDGVILRYVTSVFMLPAFLLLIAVFFFYLMHGSLCAQSQKHFRTPLRLAGILFACGLSWYVLFPGHAFAHMYVPFLYRHIVPSAALFLALFANVLFLYLRQKKVKMLFVWPLWTGAVAALLVLGVVNSGLPVTPSSVRSARDFATVKEFLLRVKDMTGPSDVIGVNYFRRPFISYYCERRTAFIPDPASLAQSDPSPRVFLFFPYQNPVTASLYESLSKNYTMVRTSSSLRFPMLAFMRKETQEH
jgi:hypothetical protein